MSWSLSSYLPSLLLSFSLFWLPSRADFPTVLPSNNSQDLGGDHSALFKLQSPSFPSDLPLAPLTDYFANLTDKQLQNFPLRGSLYKVNVNDFAQSSQTPQIACVSCDPEDYTGSLSVGQNLQYVIGQKFTAVVLYSASATHCNISSDAQVDDYRYVFTFNSTDSGIALKKTLNGSNSNGTASIVPMSIPPGGGTGADVSGSGSDSGDSPNTAMIILYSITGIITALFLGIIITGAVRAHRHPERYGPRRVAGRPRQSRARGIARAMLETIPIVKFGDEQDGVAAAKRDVELSVNPEDPAREHSPHRSDSISDAEHTTTPRETELPTANQSIQSSPDDAGVTPAPTPKPDTAADGGNFSCPICTDDFIKGQDLRVLPCSHQFHPECIDPWLINVSGTCPLCRIDLNPNKTEENGEENENGENTEETPTTAEGTATPTAEVTQSRHNRLTNYLHGHGPLNARRMRNATVEERLAALRRVREENQDEAANESNVRPRLTRRLRDRFRIRTRAHGLDSSPEASGTSTPTVPPPAHTAPEGSESQSRT
ncbi:hypothetical protein N7481_012942 [Penicillium waksmanii]|uniref:uncharacterized protein n=1 Tax=Penicillium waksmanii TaxID=69791 RepID=UPI002548D304|nr:uncharacterized protein N7481_012942 [Penicillium waksmanii]KAJ5966228.1 hypothetical protein N7481_012942 [Penicillium waksmanii]